AGPAGGGGGVTEPVEDDDVGPLEQLAPADGDEAGVAGAGADEVDDPAQAAAPAARRRAATVPARLAGSARWPSASARPVRPPSSDAAKATRRSVPSPARS